MTFSREHLVYFIAFMVVGGILGVALGSFIGKMFPSMNVINAPLTKPIGFDLEIISLYIRFNFAAIFGMIIGVLLFKWI